MNSTNFVILISFQFLTFLCVQATPPNPNIDKRLLTPDTGCGFNDASFNRVLYGEPSSMGTWPWLALIGSTDDLGKFEFHCGGSLISKRHILTAAQCVRSTLTTVRLGEYNLDVDDETQHIDIPVVKTVVHPNYDKKDGHSGLAILQLGQDVNFTKLIYPICIPFEEPLKSKDYENYNPFLAGWGHGLQGCGKPLNILQEVQSTILNNLMCAEKYKEHGKLLSGKQFDNTVFCSGNLASGRDICEVDVGGPLMSPTLLHNKTYFYQTGVTSYGFGHADVYVPAVYVRVQTFTDWIEEQVSQPIE